MSTKNYSVDGCVRCRRTSCECTQDQIAMCNLHFMLDHARTLTTAYELEIRSQAARIADLEQQVAEWDIHLCGPCDYCNVSSAHAHECQEAAREINGQLAAVTAERDRLRIEIEELARERSDARSASHYAAEHCVSLETERDRLRAMLDRARRYVRHGRICEPMVREHDEQRCECGLVGLRTNIDSELGVSSDPVRTADERDHRRWGAASDREGR